MTSGQMENAYWKLQSDSNIPIINSSIMGSDSKLTNGLQSLKDQPNQQQHQISLSDLMNQQNKTNLNNMNALHNLNEMFMQTSMINQQHQKQQQQQTSNRGSFTSHQQNMNPVRELGAIEKILNGYGFIKSLNRENGLFFQYNNSQNLFKVGDIVEFNESFDKNNKPVAINLVKIQANDIKPQQPQKMNLKDLLLNPQQNQQFNQQQQNYENFLNDLKQFKLQQQQHVQENSQLNNLISLFNKENMFQSHNYEAINSQQQQQQQQQQNNILNNMAKLSGLHQSNSLPDFKNISADYIEGTVAIPANQQQFNAEGRIQYQRNGETFYIPYLVSDLIQTNVQLRSSDRVKFCITQRQMNNMFTFFASRVELAEPLSNNLTNTLLNNQSRRSNQKLRGIISWLKDSFGKIEREDLAKETFFHFTDYKGDMNELRLGTNVEFEIQDRYGKEIAVNIKTILNGSVSFDELSRNIFIGRILTPPIMNSVGRLIYDGNNNDNLIELTFTDRDRINGASEYTFLEGDFVQFRIATDKRKRLNQNFYQQQQQQEKRATQLTLIEEYSLDENSINTNEHREKGVLTKITNDKYGAIKCLEKDDLVYFSFNEIISFAKLVPDSVTYKISKTNLELGDSLEFSVVQCQRDQIFSNGLKAIRIVKLSKNSVQFEIVSSEIYNGWIDKEASSSDFGLIKYESSSQKIETIFYKLINESDVDQKKKQVKNLFNKGDRVQFNLLNCLKSKKQFATNLKLAEQRKQTGYVTMLKENYGFIELNLFDDSWKNSKSNTKDIFFHYSSYQDSISDLDIGDEVEFTINRKNKQKLSAENVCKIESKSPRCPNSPIPGVLKGKIIQALRSHSGVNDQSNEYYGKIQVESNKKEPNYQYGIFSLSDRKIVLQIGDTVSFQLIETPDGSKKACNILLIQQAQQDQTERSNEKQQTRSKEAKKGKIESIKGHCGYIEYTSGTETKKIFFHVSDFTEPKNPELSDLKPGDEVEFQISNRNGKLVAGKIKKTGYSSSNQVTSSDILTEQRPERLVTKLKSANIDNESGKQLILTRGPFNPDGKTKSFSRVFKERLPGQLDDTNESS
ncbi:unnamed protein product [Brachionus calyciflorus]|uniref:CSD domain-containing protein n=1 Tax=Brachionus calyciflorus TaxID=104777 RepID=A0A813V1A2_9BILA|nr:unnamed protein product [Brachionus calyciflorus]